jgi:NUMOD4 motif-containing protein/HNH endonuclease
VEKHSPVAERWLPVVQYEGFYEVSDLGRIRSIDRVVRRGTGLLRLRGRVRARQMVANGRYIVQLYANGVHDNRYIAQLVLEAFVGPPPGAAECCHNNGDNTDNRLVNLRWDTHSANMLDKQLHGTDPYRNRTHCPRHRLLSHPNLVRCYAVNGLRSCLACNRASSAKRRATRRGEAFNFQAAADEQYRRIIMFMKPG